MKSYRWQGFGRKRKIVWPWQKPLSPNLSIRLKQPICSSSFKGLQKYQTLMRVGAGFSSAFTADFFPRLWRVRNGELPQNVHEAMIKNIAVKRSPATSVAIPQL